MMWLIVKSSLREVAVDFETRCSQGQSIDITSQMAAITRHNAVQSGCAARVITVISRRTMPGYRFSSGVTQAARQEDEK